jgi:hypothetical protein
VPRLIRAKPLTTTLVLLLASTWGLPSLGSERALPNAPDPPRGRRWELDTHIGYGASWTTAQSYLGLGTGIVGGVTFALPIHVEFGAIYYGGSNVFAQSGSFFYSAREWSTTVHVGAGFELSLLHGRLAARPKAILSEVFLSDTTQLGGARRHELDPMTALGVGGTGLVRFLGLHAGVDAQALFVPSRVAAPIGAIHGVFGVELP